MPLHCAISCNPSISFHQGSKTIYRQEHTTHHTHTHTHTQSNENIRSRSRSNRTDNMAYQQLPKAAAAAAAVAASSSQRLKTSKAFTSLDGKAVLTHIGVGMGAASFWRGAWYILDDHLFPEDPTKSAMTSFLLGCTGMTLCQGLVGRLDQFEKYCKQKSKELVRKKGSSNGTGISYYRKYVLPVKVARFGALYTIAISCVLVWRGTWLGWDVIYEMTHPINRSSSNSNHNNRRKEEETDHNSHNHHHHVGIEQLHAHHQHQQQHTQQHQTLQRINSTDPGHATTSGMLSHIVAVTVLCTTGLFASVLAPPAATSVIRDFTVKASSMATKTATTTTSATSKANSAAFGTGTSYSGPAQNLVSQLFGGTSVETGSSNSSGGSSSISGIPTSSSSTMFTGATASYHHHTSNTTITTPRPASVANNTTVIAKSPYLRLKETPKMSRNHNPLGGNTATSIH